MLTTLFSFLKQLAMDFYDAAREEDRVRLCAFLVILLLKDWLTF
jgi:hypothetical protein